MAKPEVTMRPDPKNNGVLIHVRNPDTSRSMLTQDGFAKNGKWELADDDIHQIVEDITSTDDPGMQQFLQARLEELANG